MKKLLILSVALVLLSGCSTNKELSRLRTQYLESDEICDCDRLFELPKEYKNLNAFPRAVELIDSIQKAEPYSQDIIYYEDSLIYKELLFTGSKNFAYIHIYNKKFHVLQWYSYLDNFKIQAYGYRFDPSSIGIYIEFDTLGNIEGTSYGNYLKFYKTEEEGEKIKKKYPICWREAYELAKLYAGVTEDKEEFTLSRSILAKNCWLVAFSDDYWDIYKVNAKTGRVKD